MSSDHHQLRNAAAAAFAASALGGDDHDVDDDVDDDDHSNWRDIGWGAEDDLFHRETEVESTANVLRDFAMQQSINPTTVTPTATAPALHLVLAGPSSPGRKRKRSDLDEAAKLATKKQPMTMSNARKRMNNALNRQSTAEKALREAKNVVALSQQRLELSEKELKDATTVVSQSSQELCDALVEDDTPWNDMYRLLVAYKEKNGDCIVPRNSYLHKHHPDPNVGKLAQWVGRQRRNLRTKRDLEEYQIAALNKIEFEWDPHRTRWMKLYNQLKDYKEKFGHCFVPINKKGSYDDSKMEDGQENPDAIYWPLGSWVKRQKYQYKLLQDGKSHELTPERIQLLEELGIVWSKRAEQWQERYEALWKYKQTNGDTYPHCNDDFHRTLGDWAREQRKQVLKYEQDPKTSKLAKSQYDLLNALPLDMDLKGGAWVARLRELKDFKRQHGHCVVPEKYPMNPKLANWVMFHRQQYDLLKNGEPTQLTHERIKILTDVGFEWEVSPARGAVTSQGVAKTWDEQFTDMRDRRDRLGTMDAGTNQELKTWLDTQREEYRKMKQGQPTKLESDQIEKLDAIGFSDMSTMSSSSGGLESTGQSWDEMFQELCKHRILYNTFGMGSTRTSLYHWVREQRLQYEKYKSANPSTLTKDRIKKLNSIAFTWDTTKLRETNEPAARPWGEMYQELLVFRIRYGSFDVPKESPLGKWMAAQRVMKSLIESKNGISELGFQRIKKLDEIVFSWKPKDDAIQAASGASTQTAFKQAPKRRAPSKKSAKLSGTKAPTANVALKQLPATESTTMRPGISIAPNQLPATAFPPQPMFGWTPFGVHFPGPYPLAPYTVLANQNDYCTLTAGNLLPKPPNTAAPAPGPSFPSSQRGRSRMGLMENLAPKPNAAAPTVIAPIAPTKPTPNLSNAPARSSANPTNAYATSAAKPPTKALPSEK